MYACVSTLLFAALQMSTSVRSPLIPVTKCATMRSAPSAVDVAKDTAYLTICSPVKVCVGILQVVTCGIVYNCVYACTVSLVLRSACTGMHIFMCAGLHVEN